MAATRSTAIEDCSRQGSYIPELDRIDPQGGDCVEEVRDRQTDAPG